jgi:hypothetical protein
MEKLQKPTLTFVCEIFPKIFRVLHNLTHIHVNYNLYCFIQGSSKMFLIFAQIVQRKCDVRCVSEFDGTMSKKGDEE